MIKLRIPVPNVLSVMATYNTIRVYRSETTRDGPFVEATATTAQSAIITGTIAGPFASLNGKTLILRTANATGAQPDIAVTFSDANPISITQVVNAVNASGWAGTASNDGSGKLRLTTTSTGRFASLLIVGGTALGDLGLALYQEEKGKDPFVPLVAGDTNYEFVDAQGRATDWYRWQFFHTGTLATSAATAPIQAQQAKIDTVKKIEDFRSTRGLTLVRGRAHTFRMSFWENQEQGIPLTPHDAGRYPSFQIVDPNGEIVQSSRAEIDGIAPNYKVLFTVPVDAPISNDDRRWRIDWFLLTDTGRTVQASEVFDVRNVDVTADEQDDTNTLALEGAPKVLRYRSDQKLATIQLQVENANSPDQTVLALPAVYPPSAPNPSLTELQDGETYVYQYTIPAGSFLAGESGGTYQAVWTLQETELSEQVNDFQIVEVPPRRALQYFKELRMVIDKRRKAVDSPQGYTDGNIWEYLKQGLRYVNSMPPVHASWSITSMPEVVKPYWIMASVLWGLNAQGLLETDLQFNFSGQSVTLDYDHQGGIDGGIARAIEFLNGFKQTKKELFRKHASVGSVANRPMRLGQRSNYVFPISRSTGSGFGSNYLALMTEFGLL